ncbi:MAG: DUF512 domain-containing protein [Tissierellia bacterium]|nr:DUF512 domain-containing protein [Tissierellia bacterium]
MELCKRNEHINIIEEIIPDSIAEELGIEPGDELLLINDQSVLDIIDYKYMINDEIINMDIKKPNGEIWQFEIEKEYSEDLGIEFTNPLIDKAKNCRNKCIFCFIDQLPPNMRETLYFKDDDSRLSFLQGNFITLTNMSEEEIDRIIKYHISPINISVHTTNPDLRREMLNNKNAGKIMEYLKRFHEANLLVNCQIVLVPGVNDGPELERTLRDLWSMHPSVNSVAIVPIGITKYREGLFNVTPVNSELAKGYIDQVEDLQKEFLSEADTRFAFLSDEFYVLADKDVPEEDEYEGYPQIENGVGLIRNFQTETLNALEEIDIVEEKLKVTFLTGKLAEEFMNKIAGLLKAKFKNYDINVKGIDNHFFGTTITVAGLVTGGDIIGQLKEDSSDVIMIPDVMLKQDEDIFLDNVTLEELEQKLNKKIIVTEVDGFDLVNKLKEEKVI